MTAGWALLVYYLLHKKFKVAIILVGTWLGIILPWLVRNLLTFGDATQGFGFPLPRAVLVALGLIRPDVGPYSPLVGTSGGVSLNVVNVPLYSTIIGMLDEFNRVYGMQFFIIFLSMSLFAFLSFSELKKMLFPGYLKLVTFLILVGLYGRAVLFAVDLNTNKDALFIQVIVLIVIPFSVFVYLKLFSKYRKIFATKQPPFAHILVIVGLLTFVPYLMYAQITGRTVPEIRLLTYGLYMVIPLAIVGLVKVVEAGLRLVHKPITIKLTQKVLILVLVGIILPQTALGISSINVWQARFQEETYQKIMHDWIRENIPPESNVGSDLPHAVLLETGLPAVNFQYSYKDDVDYEKWIIKKFDLDYLVFYYPKDDRSVSLRFTDLDEFRLVPVYEGPRNIIYKIEQ
jgi:hypothetical protein